ncbi:MAG: 16S rRNA (guanine(527)-N(7))-methyltransferase RsmG [Clostridiales bacterium]|nr:16S rRNA (guanine(527)-N(7))-methyltransferase RsmG [Clostridiales bacterium]
MRKEQDLEIFYEGLNALGISLSDAQMEQFLLYYNLLVEKNKVMNLTAIINFDSVVRKHFIDSLCLVKAMPDLGSMKVLDLGTGAGFPGVPLKIMFPDIELMLLDSTKKKLRFLDIVIEKLNLSKSSTIHGRAEDIAKIPEYREQFDLCVSRAVADLSVLVEYSLPFVKVGGTFVAYKSDDIVEELDIASTAINLLGGKTDRVLKFTLPGGDDGRSLICIGKRNTSPDAYPRKPGVAPREPLK